MKNTFRVQSLTSKEMKFHRSLQQPGEQSKNIELALWRSNRPTTVSIMPVGLFTFTQSEMHIKLIWYHHFHTLHYLTKQIHWEYYWNREQYNKLYTVTKLIHFDTIHGSDTLHQWHTVNVIAFQIPRYCMICSNRIEMLTHTYSGQYNMIEARERYEVKQRCTARKAKNTRGEIATITKSSHIFRTMVQSSLET